MPFSPRNTKSADFLSGGEVSEGSGRESYTHSTQRARGCARRDRVLVFLPSGVVIAQNRKACAGRIHYFIVERLMLYFRVDSLMALVQRCSGVSSLPYRRS